MFRPKSIAVATLTLLLSASALAGTTYEVGTCLPHLPVYTTISQAVSSVPSGSTIKVCPGNYPEQVLITQPLTLEGVPGGTSEAVVVVPGGGLTQNVFDNEDNNVYYQIVVQNTTGPVNITNLVVDGTGGTIPETGEDYVVGIYYQNASGSVTSASVRNQTSFGLAVGIYADCGPFTGSLPPTLTIENNVVRGQDGFGISVQKSGFNLNFIFAPTIKANTVDGAQAESIFLNTGGTVQSNTIRSSGVTAGLVLGGAAATVTGNTISAVNWAILTDADGSTITSNTLLGGGVVDVVDLGGGTTILKENKIDAAGQIGVELSRSASIVVQSNTIVNSSTAVDGKCGQNSEAKGATVTRNIITDAAIGVYLPSGNTVTGNTLHATAAASQTCP